MQLVSIKDDKKALCIDGKKLLYKLGISEDNLTAELIRDALFVLTEEEREELFNSCSVFSTPQALNIVDAFEKEEQVNELRTFSFIDFSKSKYERPVSEIRKDLKYEKNPMRIKQLNKELNDALKYYKKKSS